jgi:enamine deaminase RidA (YjgF/YER057c/UK114 family)
LSRKNISSNTPWEKAYGYSRAVRIDNVIEIAGTVASDETGAVQGETVYEQTRYILAKIEKALVEAGGSLSDVVRTRWYLTDISRLDEAGRAHGEIFGEIRPVSTAVEVSGLAGEGFLIEIEVRAVVSG